MRPLDLANWKVAITCCVLLVAPVSCRLVIEDPVTSYVQGLVRGDEEAFFEFNAEYQAELEHMKRQAPKSMWADRTGSLKAKWSQRLRGQFGAAGKEGPELLNRAWPLLWKSTFQPRVRAIEVREGSGEAFVSVDYDDPGTAPVVGRDPRPLRSVVLGVAYDPARNVVDSSARWIDDTVAYFALPFADLTPGHVEKLLRPTVARPRVRFRDPVVMQLIGRSAFEPSLELLNESGISWGGTTRSSPLYPRGVSNLKFPADWEALRVSSPKPEYFLATVLNLSVLDVGPAPDQRSAIATYQFRWTDCPGPCRFVEAALGRDGRTVATTQPIDGFRNTIIEAGPYDTGELASWAQGATYRARLDWSRRNGWQVAKER